MRFKRFNFHNFNYVFKRLYIELRIKKSDLLIINKTDLANHVNVDLDQMKLDVETARSGMPYIFGEMKNNKGIENVTEFLKTEGGLEIN